jgi:GntR family transcriptional regulator/MocR family aminotransferase
MPFFKTPPLKPASEMPIYRQLYDYLRGAILAGQLKTCAALPSTRALAEELGVSRNTVLGAYHQLLAEGYLEAFGGKGTFVSKTLPDNAQSPARRGKLPAERSHSLSAQASRVIASPMMPPSPHILHTVRAFETGMPALDRFPYELWSKLVSRHAHRLHPGMLAYQHAAGYAPLRAVERG